MVNIDLWGIAVILRQLRRQGELTEKEAQKIFRRIAMQTGADLIISL